jgi:hypothetical protein
MSRSHSLGAKSSGFETQWQTRRAAEDKAIEQRDAPVLATPNAPLNTKGECAPMASANKSIPFVVPAQSIPKQRPHRTRTKMAFLSTDEVLAVLKAARERSSRDWAMILLAYRHGLRASEVCNLKLSDADTKNFALTIERLKGSLKTVQPLSEHRGIPLLDEVKAIKSWLSARVEDGSGYLFLSQKGGPLSLSCCRLHFVRPSLLSTRTAVRWTILLGLSLALAESLHYYAVFDFLPFILSEGVQFLEVRQFRWGVWIALMCGFLPLGAYWPMLSRLKALYGQYFWSQPSLQMAKSSYSWYLNIPYQTGIAVAGVSTIAVLWTTLRMIRQAPRGESKTESKAESFLKEPIMILAFLSLPFVGFFATILAHSGMSPKYLHPTVLGFPLALSYVFPRLGSKNSYLVPAFGILFLLALAPREALFWSSYSSHFPSPADPVEAFVGLAGHGDLPVAVSDAQDFMPLAHYASPEWAKRFIYLVDATEDVSTGTEDAECLSHR